ncbi:hypothetical protein AMATHDRAFT_139077 [Amanita thiersii Skay4041]|uniref:RING-type E3 ubiquitin transferase (cysteine targeting) n=1 Tax=Amanita thiersii Skay4041 TaxID=703135 RepID=A0A2A9NU09_9AGAR|nr:hypothetical protein AMATHDRAFT_139077 [Amanita thiersii Skay4041]
MSSLQTLQRSWENAQNRIPAIKQNLVTTHKSRIIRVGQLDAELLDQELVQLLQEPFSRALSHISTSLQSRYEHELSLFMQLILYKMSVWNTGASYGAKLQDLHYVVATPSEGVSSFPRLPRRILLLHCSLTVFIPYFHNRIRTYALSHSWSDAPSSDRRRKFWNFLITLESTHTLFGLINFIAFLWNGRHRTLVDRLLGMQLVPSRKLVRRDVSYEFMNRQMVWHAFTEFLIFLLPLINARAIRRRILRLTSYLSLVTLTSRLPGTVLSRLGISSNSPKGTRAVSSKRGKYWTLPRDQCAICAENASFNLNLSQSANVFSSLTLEPQQHADEGETASQLPTYPLTTPYIASCGDIYCYHCITERMIHVAEDGAENLMWDCLRCGESVIGADRYSGITAESETSDYEFSDMDFESTDMSGSMGSYAYSDSVISDSDVHTR